VAILSSVSGAAGLAFPQWTCQNPLDGAANRRKV
jgi:hypothetical protein